ncbi:hypothetical protein PsYK624_052930 [Phanerochaete sordida]|uniref:Uncharacterized protein n=1 Tax=Phanerochaete sordida TaxID=48140 RepID=A0A9P3G6J8_9APHY|nr:hypothetical protein PsYK624_052930 [Phanerochaete sordida]
MRFTQAFAVLAALAVSGLATPVKRQANTVTQVVSVSYITAPSSGISMAAEQSTSFSVANGWYGGCYPAFTPMYTYIMPTEPTTAGLNNVWGYDDYLVYLGEFLEHNSNAPSIPMSTPPPPSSMTMPTLDSSYVSQTVWLTTVMNFTGCAPDGHIVIGVSSVPITYTG